MNTRERLAAEEPELVETKKEQKGMNIKLYIQQVERTYSVFELVSRILP